MKKLLLICCLLTVISSYAQQENYWQQHLNYVINVSLDDAKHTLKGDISIDYTNNSPDTLQYIWFHLWPNAYRDEKTALAKQLSADKSRRKIKDADRGYIDSLLFTANGTVLRTQPDAENIDVLKVLLDKPLLPGSSTKIATPFFVKLPNYFSRSGHVGQKYIICQWYPKPAVYDHKGWHQFPYLDQGEFYSEFGKFTVNITLPAPYIVGATGTLQNADELTRYKEIGRLNHTERSTLELYKPASLTAAKTLSFVADSVHDFAWFADKEFVIRYDTLQLSSGRVVDAFSYHQPNGNREWLSSIDFIEDAVRKYSSWIGEYPYQTVAAVEGPKNQSSGGMEYPMITLITSPEANKESLDAVITHEVGHNWFYGILASNERQYPWMDEGLNTYFQFRYEAEKYRYNSIFGPSVPKEIQSLPAQEFQSRIYNALSTIPAQKAIATNSTGFSNKEEYGIVVYLKTAIWMFIVESSVGTENLDKGMREYFDRWKFKHPYPEDLKRSLESGSGQSLDELFSLLQKEGNFK